MLQLKDDLSRSLVALEQDKTLIAVVELSLTTWLVGGVIPGIERDPLKKLVPDEEGLLKLLYRWRDEAFKAGHTITRMVIGFEAGRDGFWLARWLGARGIEAYVIHPTSIAVSREQRRAKTDRLDVGLLKRSLLGWLRGEKKHLGAAAPKCFSAEQIIMRSGQVPSCIFPDEYRFPLRITMSVTDRLSVARSVDQEDGSGPFAATAAESRS